MDKVSDTVMGRKLAVAVAPFPLLSYPPTLMGIVRGRDDLWKDYLTYTHSPSTPSTHPHVWKTHGSKTAIIKI